MDAETIDHLASALSSVATTIALLVGAIWAWHHFVRRRDLSPKVDLTVGVEFLGPHPDASCRLLQVTADLANSGTVRHEIASLTYSLRVLCEDDACASSEAVLGQVVFPTSIVSKRRFFPEDWGGSFVDAGVTNTYRSVTTVPSKARFVLATARFVYAGDKASDFHMSERAFPVPA